MYSICLSKIEKVIDVIKDDIKPLIKKNSKVLLLPWAFPVEINAERLENEFFKKGEKRYQRYIDSLAKIGIKEENIIIGNCYSDSKKDLQDVIKQVDILVLPGGNPEMFYSKVVQECEILYDIKHFEGIIIGESAGCELQLKRYFITAKNNFYKYFAFYDGFGVIDDPFYMDVHSINNKLYLNKLQSIANEKKKKVYAIFDDGALIYNRKTEDIKLLGNVKTFIPQKIENKNVIEKTI